MKKLVFFLTFVITLSGYLLTVPSHPIGYADSEEFLTTAHLFSVAHPSGYPLVTILLGLVHVVVPTISLALLANLTSSVVMALALALLATIMLELLYIFTPEISSVLGALLTISLSTALGFSSLIWLYAITFEIVSFTVFLAISVFGSTIYWQKTLLENPSRSLRWFYLTIFLAAVNLSHVQTTVLLLPPLALILFVNRKKLRTSPPYNVLSTWLKGIIIFFIPVIIYVIALFALNARTAEVSWYFPQNIQGVIDFIFRKDYTGRYVDEDKIRPAYLTPITSQYLTVMPKYTQTVVSHLGIIIAVFGIFGLGFLIKHRRHPLALFIVSVWFLTGPLLAGRLGIPASTPTDLSHLMRIGVLHRQYLTGEVSFSIIALFGFALLLRAFLKRSTSRTTTLFLSATLLVLVVYNVTSNISIGYQRHNRVIEQYAYSMLMTADPNSVIICSADIACFSLLYQNIVQSVRSDVTVLTQNNLYRRYFLTTHKDMYDAPYQENPYFYAALISSLIPKQSVYLTNPSDYYISYIGLDGDPFFLIPQGYLYQVVTNPKGIQSKAVEYDASKSLLTTSFSDKDFFGQGLRDYFAGLHATSGLLHSRYNNKAAAQTNFELALNLEPLNPLINEQLLALPAYEGDEHYIEGTASSSAEYQLNADKYLQAGDLQVAYDLARKASYLDPTNIQYRLFIAQLLVDGGFNREALNELLVIQSLEPNNATASALLQQL